MKRKGKHSGSHGLVSVFLAIILVPCIVFTCIFGDLSRVQLSMATATSAGDLALYSLLSRYDEQLKEYYGLVASCQNINEFYGVTETYFQGMLEAEGVSGEGSALFQEYLRQLQTEGYSDFLRCTLSNLKVTEANDSRMSDNPALIEDGIVEFMKYRGPVALTTKLLDRLTDMNFDSQLTEVDKNKTVTDAKQDYAESQGNLLSKALYTYLAIREYEKAQQQNNCPNAETYRVLEETLQNNRDDLKAVTAIITKYYFPGSETIKTCKSPFLELGDYSANVEDFAICTQDEAGNEIYCLDNAGLEDLLDGIDDTIEDIQDTGDDFVSAYREIGSPDTGVNYVVYCLKVQKVVESSDLITTMKTKGDTLLKQYARIKAASENCVEQPEGNDLPQDWAAQLAEAMEKIEKLHKKYYDASNTGGSDYVKDLSEYIKKAAEVAPKVLNRQYTFTSKSGSNVTLDLFAQGMASQINSLRSCLQEQIDRLNVAIDGGTLPSGETVSSQDDLATQAQNFTDSRQAWGTAAQNSHTTYGDAEYELYQGAVETSEGGEAKDAEQEGEKIAAQITRESVNELKTRLVNIRTDMQNCLNALTAVTYGGTALQDLNSAEALIAAACTVVPETTDLSLAAADAAAEGYFTQLMRPADGTILSAAAQNNASDGNNPSLTTATPKLYAFMKKQLQENEESVQDNVTENNAKNEKYKSDAKQKEEDAKAVPTAELGDDIEESSGGSTIADISVVDSLLGVADNLMNGSGDELRDQLYVCEYIMDMFSYSTFNNEGKYKLANNCETDESQKTNTVTFRDCPYSSVQEEWDRVDATQVTSNQSLTNVPINAASNHAFQGEVEYILYGNTSLEANIRETYTDILLIREPLNLVSAFCNFYKNALLTEIAAGVSAATAGIVPIPVTKCVLLLVLATLESAKDLERLRAGAPVELYKVKSQDWFYNLDMDGAAFPPEDGAVSSESGLYYSDYLYFFLMMGATSGEEVYSSMLLRVGDLIQANMRRLTGNDKFTLDNTYCYFSLQSDVRVKPLMISLPIVSSVQGSEKMREGTDWCTYHLNLIRGYS